MTSFVGARANADLRRHLGQVTELTGDSVGQQVPSVASLKGEYGHSIELITPAIPGDPSSFRYTCFQHAFGLVDPPKLIVDIATLWPAVYPSAGFVQYLIDNYLTEVAAAEVSDGDVAVYLANGTPVHAGVVSASLIVSKWGTAHLWRHGLFEVPAAYGDTVRFFGAIDANQSHEAFLRFAERETGERFLNV